MIVTPIVEGLIGGARGYLNNKMRQNVMRDFRNQLYQHLQSLPMSFFYDAESGAVEIDGINVKDIALAMAHRLSTILAADMILVF